MQKADSSQASNQGPELRGGAESPARRAQCEEVPQRLEIPMPLRTFFKVFAALLIGYAV